MMAKTVRVGVIGAGWAGEMHAKAYSKVYGVDYELRYLCALEDGLDCFARRFGFKNLTKSFDDVINDDEIDLVDIITPSYLHFDMIKKALIAGKDVVCEKPLTGYFGRPGDPEFVGTVDKKTMLNRVKDELDEIGELLKKTGRNFCYAENWVYSPVFERASELIKAKKTKLLEIHSVTGHKGSHAKHAPYWKYTGGGTLIRQSIHPIGSAIYMKQLEAEARGEDFGVRSIWCDASAVTANIEDKGYLQFSPKDVEDWAQVIITFKDGTKASLTGGDIYVGEILNKMSFYGTDAVYHCNMTPNDILEVYFSDEKGIEKEFIMEKSDHNMGFIRALVSEEYIRGYYGEIQDFLECVSRGDSPKCAFSLARDSLLLVYAAYLSAESGSVVYLDGILD
jgi:predicted dehydrogenase